MGHPQSRPGGPTARRSRPGSLPESETPRTPTAASPPQAWGPAAASEPSLVPRTFLPRPPPGRDHPGALRREDQAPGTEHPRGPPPGQASREASPAAPCLQAGPTLRPAECPSASSENARQLLSPTALPDRRLAARPEPGAGEGRALRERRADGRQAALRATSAQGAGRQEVQPGLQRGPPQGHTGGPASPLRTATRDICPSCSQGLASRVLEHSASSQCDSAVSRSPLQDDQKPKARPTQPPSCLGAAPEISHASLVPW